MKINELIEELEKVREEHGNLDVVTYRSFQNTFTVKNDTLKLGIPGRITD